MNWHVRSGDVKQNVVILASKASHCLHDLLHRWQVGELDCNIPRVIANHDTLRDMVEWHCLAFHHVPVPKIDKAEAL
jgi:formyltetrahydrofolate deformylase